jgi:signal transduction histidine kinase
MLFTGWASAQSIVSPTTSIDVSKILESKDIQDKCDIYIADHSGSIKSEEILNSQWRPLSEINTEKAIPDEWVTETINLKFTLENKADTAIKVYFIAGTYLRSMRTFKLLSNNQLQQIKNESLDDGYQPILLSSGEKQGFVVKFNFTKSDFNFIRPVLLEDGFLAKYKNLKHYKYEAPPAVGYLLSGILLMMVFFTGVNFIVSQKKEFLFNCCYSICMFSLVFLNTFLDRKSGLFSSLFHEYLDFMLLSVGTIFYVAFTRKFLETKAKFPLLNKIFVFEEKMVLIILTAFTFIVFFTNFYTLQKNVENGMKLIVLIIGIIYIIIALSQKNRLMNYLAIGNALLIFFSIVSMSMILFPKERITIFTSSMIYYEVGIVSELIFFLLGLSYKNRIELIGKIKEQESLKLEAEKQSFENKLAVLNAQQEERNRISADMHDDLGAGVTAIRLYSELAKKRLGNEVIPEIEKISSSANELLNNMNAIIWTMSSSNDTFHNMVAYIRSYAQEYFENTGINCHIYIEENIPNIAVGGEVRRNVYMVVKEALNNILKHSKATEVNISLKREKEGLSLYIQDNGTGIDFEKLRRFGNGLINMKKRMEKMQILFSIENNNGTLVTLHTRVDF